MLRKGFLVEVQLDHIIVRITGTSYTASYYRMENSTDLVARNLPLRDDHRAPMNRLELSKALGSSLKPKRSSLSGSTRIHFAGTPGTPDPIGG
jgi:hypothetical protein